jgi:hypothetical protein
MRQFRVERLVHRPHALLKDSGDPLGARVLTKRGNRRDRTKDESID